MTDRLTPAAALRAIAAGDGRYGVLLSHGSMELGAYAPRDSDPQSPHEQDELYIVQAGSGYFRLEDERRPFAAGDVLFVPAGREHRFEDFTDDFMAWVVFWGPAGGERDDHG